jgi:hypothetical protein
MDIQERSRIVRDLSKLFNHMKKTSDVMFDRSMWFAPIYKTLMADNFRALCQSYTELAEKENQVDEPVRYALGYSQTVFLGTAIELTLLHLYINSLSIFQRIFSGDLSSLKHFPRNLLSISPIQLFDELKKLSFSDISKTQNKFSDIYGENCFLIAWTPQVYASIAEEVRKLQDRRNGIVHRGGEYQDGRMIEVSKDEIQQTLTSARRLRVHFANLSDWCLSWWLEQISQRYRA